MSQYPRNFSYLEVDNAVSLNSLETRGVNLGYGSQETLKDLDFGMGLGWLENFVGLPHFSN